MIVHVVEVVVFVGVRVTDPIGVLVLVLVEDHVQRPAERAGDPAQGAQAREMRTALQPRDNRFGHASARGEVALRLAASRSHFRERTRDSTRDARCGKRSRPGTAVRRFAHLRDVSNFAKYRQTARCSTTVISDAAKAANVPGRALQPGGRSNAAYSGKGTYVRKRLSWTIL